MDLTRATRRLLRRRRSGEEGRAVPGDGKREAARCQRRDPPRGSRSNVCRIQSCPGRFYLREDHLGGDRPGWHDGGPGGRDHRAVSCFRLSRIRVTDQVASLRSRWTTLGELRRHLGSSHPAGGRWRRMRSIAQPILPTCARAPWRGTTTADSHTRDTAARQASRRPAGAPNRAQSTAPLAIEIHAQPPGECRGAPPRRPPELCRG